MTGTRTPIGHSAYFLLAVLCVLLQGKRGFVRREGRQVTDLVTRNGR